MTKAVVLSSSAQSGDAQNAILPKIVVTSASEEPDSHRHWATEQIQMKLVTLDEKYRSHVLYQQIKAFEDKIYMCHDNFNTETMLSMLRELSKRLRGSKDIYTLTGLRQAFRQEARRIHMRSRGKKPGFQTNHAPDQIMTYFSWFFEYLKYIRELRANFVDRIFNPLFRYFFENGSNGPDRERSLDSAMSMSNISMASYGSFDSGLSGLSGLSSWSSLAVSDTDSQASTDDIHETRQRMLSRTSLLLLGREIRDVKQLYDTTELEKIAHRLSYLKEQMDFLLDKENKINPEMFSQDSENSVYRLNVKNVRTHCFIRLIPDVLVKCQKAAWLSRRWLQLDDLKSKNLNRKLNKLAAVEDQLSRRLSVLSKDIQKHEQELEKGMTDLQKLLKREERSNELHLAVHEIEDTKLKLDDKLEKLRIEKHELSEKLQDAMKYRKQREFKNIKMMYERNKLQRYAMKRQIATLKFHQTLVSNDMCVELEVKPNIIHFTNDVQERCEELEMMLESARKEQRTVKAALVPITKDRELLTERIRDNQFQLTSDNATFAFERENSAVLQNQQKAVYIRSYQARPSFSGNIPGRPKNPHYTDEPPYTDRNNRGSVDFKSYPSNRYVQEKSTWDDREEIASEW